MRVMRTLMVMRCTPWRHPEPEMTTIATLTAQRDALQAEWDALIRDVRRGLWGRAALADFSASGCRILVR